MDCLAFSPRVDRHSISTAPNRSRLRRNIMLVEEEEEEEEEEEGMAERR